MEIFLLMLSLVSIYLIYIKIKASKIEKLKSEPEFSVNYKNVSDFFEEISILKKDYIIHDDGELLLKKYATAYQYLKTIPY